MINLSFYLLIAVEVLFLQTEAKQFTRCELVWELRRQRFPENLLRDWVCLVEAESERRTDVVGGPNSNGSRDYGLFQINDKYWCSNTDSPGNKCNVTCSQLLTADITAASDCAKMIFNLYNFRAWFGWIYNCQEALPDISHCKH